MFSRYIYISIYIYIYIYLEYIYIFRIYVYTSMISSPKKVGPRQKIGPIFHLLGVDLARWLAQLRENPRKTTNGRGRKHVLQPHRFFVGSRFMIFSIDFFLLKKNKMFWRSGLIPKKDTSFCFDFQISPSVKNFCIGEESWDAGAVKCWKKQVLHVAPARWSHKSSQNCQSSMFWNGILRHAGLLKMFVFDSFHLFFQFMV